MTKKYRPLAVFCWLVAVSHVFSLTTTPVYHGSSPSNVVAHVHDSSNTTKVTDYNHTVAALSYFNSTDNHDNAIHLLDNHDRVTHQPEHQTGHPDDAVDHNVNLSDHVVELYSNESDHHDNSTEHEEHKIRLASLNFDYVKEPLVISILLLIVAICKFGFHHAHWLSSRVPESCILIIIGTIVGTIIFFTDAEEVHFSSRTFFLLLLPPIILEAAYSLHNRVFFDNLGTVLLYAVLGTILNFIIIGTVLYGLAICGAMGSISISMVQCLVFAALIVAVDPVAVLAIFQELGVNNVLYFLVFGESLFNDAVTVVIYNTMKTFALMTSIPVSEIFMAVGAFFTVSLCGLAIGLVVGALTAVLTKYTRDVRVVEPLAVFIFAYTSYLLAELFHFSGIISIIGCGLMQAQYTFPNISRKSHTTVIYFIKMFSMACDSIIFMALGLSLVSDQHVWHTGFILWSVFLCLVVRFSVTYFLTFFANRYGRLRQINWEEQFIMAYGGLRGAVAFSLVTVLDQDSVSNQRLFQTTTLVIIICTVFVQGISIAPLVKLLRISSKSDKKPTFCEEINSRMTEHIMSGIEEICGRYGDNRVRNKFYEFDNHYLKKWLMREPKTNDETIMDLFEEQTFQIHIENVTKPSGWVAFAEEQDDIDSDITELDEDSDESEGATYLTIDAPPRTLTKSASFKVGKISTANSPVMSRIQTPPSTLKLSRMVSIEENEGISTVSLEYALIKNKTDTFKRKRTTSSPTMTALGGDNLSRMNSARWSRRSQRRQRTGSAEEPTVNDVRKWLVKVPTTEMKYDRDLVHAESRDLMYHLLQKELRTQRKRIHMANMGARAPTGSQSCMSSPMHSTVGSMANIARAGATLDVITEGVSLRHYTRRRSITQ